MSGPALVRRTADGEAGSNILNIRVVPVIFIPGVMGSRLSVPGGLDWDPDSVLAMAQLSLRDVRSKTGTLSVDRRPQLTTIRALCGDAQAAIKGNARLKKLADALKQDVVALYEDRGWGTIAWGFYADILMQLETELNIAEQDLFMIPNPVYAFGYDWRRSNADSGAALLTFVADVLAKHPGARRVILVTHSMGGLVARAAIALNPGVVANVLGVVHGAQPSNGAVVAYRRFLTGANKQTDPATSSGVKAKVGAFVLNRIMGTTPDSYTTLQAGLPGPLQLLPNHLYHHFDDRPPWLQSAPPANLDAAFGVYAMPERPGVLMVTGPTLELDVLGVNAALSLRLVEAGGFHTFLGTTAHPNTHVLFSSGVPTDVGVDLTSSSIVIDKQPLGDGTVPGVSGRCPHLPSSSVKLRREFTGLEHAGVYADSGFNQAALESVRTIMLELD
ncbi:MAG TPA: hypothetical protein VHG72_18380 [Polyangia bacterium]|nr:hypothetical protein [Polyangia bacterium]